MDEIDIASERELAQLENRIAEHQYQLAHAVNAYPEGECRNCGEKSEEHFCSAECRDDFQYRQRIERMNRKYRGG